jgi:hypothetical protein
MVRMIEKMSLLNLPVSKEKNGQSKKDGGIYD